MPARRQRPGAACEECRRRKLKCNGAKPKCSVCEASNSECIVSEQRPARGPKRGFLTSLKDRIAQLESLLHEKHHADQGAFDLDSGINTDSEMIVHQKFTTPRSDMTNSSRTVITDDASDVFQSKLTNCPMFDSMIAHSRKTLGLTDMIEEELNQLYFDRIYPFFPIIQRRRYRRQFNSDATKSASRFCLQYSIWTLASLMSSQFQHLQELLYAETKQMLERLELLPNIADDCINMELLQSWLLIASYESIKAHHRQAWLSAGRAFRLAQLMNLHQLDKPSDNEDTASSTEEIIAKEEMRRTYWMAYLLDHLLSMRNDWPVTLTEHVICTQLPASEADFQAGRRSVGVLLSEAITETRPTTQSTFNECLILVTICGRSLSSHQQNNIQKMYGASVASWSEQHKWLTNILNNRTQTLKDHYPAILEAYDPTLLFVHILSQATILYLCKNILGYSASLQTPEEESTLFDTRIRALAAADEVINLSKMFSDFHIYEVHPLIRIPLFVSCEFLYEHRSNDDLFNERFEDLCIAFRQLKSFHDPSMTYMDLLEQSCTKTSMEMVSI